MEEFYGMEDYLPDYNIEMSIEDIRLLHTCVCTSIANWPGGKPHEQENLFRVRDSLYRIILDYRFHNA